MPAYTPKNWGPTDTVTEADLDHLENGVAAVATQGDALDTRVTSVESRTTNAEGTLTTANSRLTALEAASGTRVLVLNAADPIPGGTTSGTVVVRKS